MLEVSNVKLPLDAGLPGAAAAARSLPPPPPRGPPPAPFREALPAGSGEPRAEGGMGIARLYL